MKKIGFFLVLGFFLLLPTAKAWWNNDWTYRMPLAVNQTGSTTLTNIPILVNGTHGVDTKALIDTGKLDNQCKCLRFVDSTDTTALDFEFESYEDSTYGCNSRNTIIWLEVDSLPTTNTTVYMYYDSSCGADFGNNTAGTWDSDFTSVIHMGEGTGSVSYDSTSNNNNATHQGTADWNSTQDGFGYSMHFGTATTDWMKIAPMPTVGTKTQTYEAWVFVDDWTTVSNDPFLGTYVSGNTNLMHLQYRRVETGSNDGRYDVVLPDGSGWVDSGAKPGIEEWHYVVATTNGTHMVIYHNGTKLATSSFTADLGTASYFQINAYGGSGGKLGNTGGRIDEVRISKIARSDDYILRQWQQDLSSFGSEEQIASIPTEINLYLNGTENNMTISYGQTVNITAEINVTGLNVELYLNNSLINNDTNRVENITNIDWFSAKVYEIKAYFPGDASYQTATTIYYLTVNKASTTLHLAINGSESDATYTYPKTTNTSAWKTVSGGTLSFERNGSSISNPEIIELSADYYNYTTSLSHENYTASPISRFLTIAQRVIDVKLFMNGTQNNLTVTYPNSTINVSTSINVSGMTFYLYRNETTINSGTDYLENVTTYGYVYYNFTAHYPGDKNNTADTVTYFLTVNKGNSQLSLTSSLGWSITEGKTTTLTCTAVSPLVITMKVEGITVSSPYTLQVKTGTYTVLCSISDTYNYTPTSTYNTIVVNPLISCTNEDTFAYNKTISTSTDFTTLNFTDLVNQHYVKKGLGDVNISGVSNIWKNTTNGYFIVVNNTGLSSFTVLFGNYFANNTYSFRETENIQNMTGYNQSNPVIIYNVLDELTGEELFPPNTTLMSIIHCSVGENYIPIDDNTTNFLLASREYIDKASLRISYTADMYYSRQLYPDESDFVILNFYVVDAYENALDRIDFKMLDVNYYDSKLQIYKPIGDSTIMITEGYFDASHYFSAYLMEDSDYYLRTVDADGTITSFGRITVVKPDEKELGKTYYSLNPQAVLIADNILMNAWTDDDRTTLYIEYSDSLNQTESVTITTYFENGTVFQNETYTTSSVSLSYNITDYANDSFTVTFTVIHATLGNSPVVYTMSLFTPIAWGITGASAMLYNLFSLGILLLVGGITTRDSLIPGSILLVVTFLILWGIGWFVGISPITQLFVFIVVILILSIINYLKQGGE